jgi:hypothetical protein
LEREAESCILPFSFTTNARCCMTLSV